MALPAVIGLIVEHKSTHNLPIRMTGARVVEVYNTAYEEVINQRNMVENGRRCGVLSSTTWA